MPVGFTTADLSNEILAIVYIFCEKFFTNMYFYSMLNTVEKHILLREESAMYYFIPIIVLAIVLIIAVSAYVVLEHTAFMKRSSSFTDGITASSRCTQTDVSTSEKEHVDVLREYFDQDEELNIPAISYDKSFRASYVKNHCDKTCSCD